MRFLNRFLMTFCAVSAVWMSPVLGGADDASRYSADNTGVTRWMGNGHRGDAEFGTWSFETVAGGGAAGRFIGDSTLGGGDINTGGKSFGLYANPEGSPTPYSAATRRFAKSALTTGDVLSFNLAVNAVTPGNRGFDLRDTSGKGVWNFDVHAGGYHVNGDDGASLDAGHHTNTVFSFTFTQRERSVDYKIRRTGGITASAEGSFRADSGTIGDVRFYISGAGADGDSQNLYFNSFRLATEPRQDAPLTLGERRMPGRAPSHLLRFSDPEASSVSIRHSGDWETDHPLEKIDGVWQADIRDIPATPGGPPLPPGWHQFKFRLNGDWEAGENRQLYIDSRGRIAEPPAVYVAWQRDPTTTFTVHWHNHDAAQNTLRWHAAGTENWTAVTASTAPFPHTERLVHTAEITGLVPGADYEFQVDGYDEAFKCRTMPADLDKPVKFAIGGDVDANSTADAMTKAVAAKDPDFAVILGDHSYEDARADLFWKWYRYLSSWFENARTSDGRLIPLVVGVGNHEIRHGYSANHPDFEDTADWRRRYAGFYYGLFAFPGAEQPYGVLDFGDYLSLVLLDTEHSSGLISATDPQTLWLPAQLESRRNVKHLVPAYHVPAYPSFRRFTGDEDADRSKRIRDFWLPHFQNAGVHLVFEHHDHAFKRTKPMLDGKEHADGITFVGDGAWGVAVREPDTSRPYIAKAEKRHHALLVTLTGTNRIIQAVDTKGDVFDEFTQPADGRSAAPRQASP